MSILLHLDDEQAALVRDSLTGARAYLQARIARVGTQEVEGKHSGLSQRKVDNIFAQCNHNHLTPAKDLPADVRRRIVDVAKILANAVDPDHQAVVIEELRAAVLHFQATEPFDAQANPA